MAFRLAALLFCALLASGGWCQKDICEGYIDSPDAPHKGPRRFNLISIAFSLADSYVLVVDPEGHRFGVDSSGKRIRSEIAQAFYEDDNTAEMDTNMLPARQPREMTIQFAKSGNYLITVTARKNASLWLSFQTGTCGKVWKHEITIPAARAGTVSRMTLVYDAHAMQEPRLLEGDQTHSDPGRSEEKSFPK